MALRIEFVEGEPRWRRELASRKFARAAAAAAAEEAGVKLARGAEMTIHLVNDERIRELNKQWRGKDSATNVLSFPAAPADRLGADHFRHLVAHGFLHLLGFDHETPAEAEAMEAIEVRALARLGVDDPYAGAELAS
jgi:probable rRNA maturation factor